MRDQLSRNQRTTKHSQGVRQLSLHDQLPSCEVKISKKIYDFKALCEGKRVLDVGCGFGRNRSVVESVGGEWVGVEPFEGGNHTVIASADDLPFEDSSFDVVVMDAVLEHLPNIEASFSEVGRVLKPGGVFVGYCAFMECFHEISYHHLSFKALEHLALMNDLNLEVISGGRRFGIDYHLGVLLYPIPTSWLQLLIAISIRNLIRVKAFAAYFARRFLLKKSHQDSAAWSKGYFELECLRQSHGFSYIIRKPFVVSDAS